MYCSILGKWSKDDRNRYNSLIAEIDWRLFKRSTVLNRSFNCVILLNDIDMTCVKRVGRIARRVGRVEHAEMTDRSDWKQQLREGGGRFGQTFHMPHALRDHEIRESYQSNSSFHTRSPTAHSQVILTGISCQELSAHSHKENHHHHHRMSQSWRFTEEKKKQNYWSTVTWSHSNISSPDSKLHWPGQIHPMRTFFFLTVEHVKVSSGTTTGMQQRWKRFWARIQLLGRSCYRPSEIGMRPASRKVKRTFWLGQRKGAHEETKTGRNVNSDMGYC